MKKKKRKPRSFGDFQGAGRNRFGGGFDVVTSLQDQVSEEQESSVDKNKIAAAAMGEIATAVEAGIITSTERVNHTSNGSRSQLLAAAAGDGTMTTTNGALQQQQQQRVNKRCLWFEEELEADLRWVFGVSK